MGNQQQYDPEVQARISRLLTHLGQVLQELGGLMPAQLAASNPERTDLSEPVPAQAAETETSAPRKPDTFEPEAAGTEVAEPEVAGTEAAATEVAEPNPPDTEENEIPGAITAAAGSIDQVLDESFAALFGIDESLPPESEAGSDAVEVEPDVTIDLTEAVAEPEPPLPRGKVTKLVDDTVHPLYLVWEDNGDRRLAAPWNWVTSTQLTEGGIPETFTLNDGQQELKMNVSRVRGIWTVRELEEWQEPVRWIHALNEELETPLKLHVPPPDPLPSPAPVPVPEAPAESPIEPVTDANTAYYMTRRVWIVSPSALARRFLMRHLDEMGLEVHEARDLDDPLLPADLNSAGALFLDESLKKNWGAHAASTLIDLPLVLLTVDGMLSVPSGGTATELQATLPRPFERSEVESVVTWLRSHWMGSGTGRSDHHGEDDDDTWLFADPFGTSSSGNNPGR